MNALFELTFQMTVAKTWGNVATRNKSDGRQ